MMLADSGYWLALANPRDSWHGAALAATRKLVEPLIVTWPVITETCYLLGRYGGVGPQIRFVDTLATSAEIHPQGIGQLSAIGELMEKYRDLPMDLAPDSLGSLQGGSPRWPAVCNPRARSCVRFILLAIVTLPREVWRTT